MAHQEQPMRPIWFFVGLVLISMGLVVAISGIVQYASGVPATALGRLHPALWWGALMTVAGAAFVIVNWNRRIGERDEKSDRADSSTVK